MVIRRNKNLLYIIYLIIFFFIWTTTYAQEIYISPFKIVNANGQAILSEAEDKRLYQLLQQALQAMSTPAVSFKPLASLSQPSLNILKRNYVVTKLEASVVCFYEKIDYLLYGNIIYEKNTDNYSAVFNLYNKNTNSIIREIKLNRNATNPEDFTKQLAPLIAKEVPAALPKAEQPEKASTNPPMQINTKTETTDKTNQPQIEKTAVSKNDSSTTSASPQTAEDQLPKTHEIQRKEKLLAAILAGGYFFILEHEWQNMVKSFAVLSAGLTYELPLIDSKDSFDFSLRAASHFQYAFANALPNRPYTHFHALKFKANIEAYFQFSELFAFFVGGGPFYRFDIIDFATMNNNFFTDHVLALGMYALVGLELMINADRTFGFGILNSVDITFYSLPSYEYNLQLFLIFKV